MPTAFHSAGYHQRSGLGARCPSLPDPAAPAGRVLPPQAQPAGCGGDLPCTCRAAHAAAGEAAGQPHHGPGATVPGGGVEWRRAARQDSSSKGRAGKTIVLSRRVGVWPTKQAQLALVAQLLLDPSFCSCSFTWGYCGAGALRRPRLLPRHSVGRALAAPRLGAGAAGAGAHGAGGAGGHPAAAHTGGPARPAAARGGHMLRWGSVATGGAEESVPELARLR